jgi:hypothetical protein
MTTQYPPTFFAHTDGYLKLIDSVDDFNDMLKSNSNVNVIFNSDNVHPVPSAIVTTPSSAEALAIKFKLMRLWSDKNTDSMKGKLTDTMNVLNEDLSDLSDVDVIAGDLSTLSNYLYAIRRTIPEPETHKYYFTPTPSSKYTILLFRVDTDQMIEGRITEPVYSEHNGEKYGLCYIM